eukprot:8385176-Pyramimonas_sp.AAC.1
MQWRPVHKKPSTRNPALKPQGVHWFLVWERHAVHGETVETQETQGTLEASKAFLGMGLQCSARGPRVEPTGPRTEQRMGAAGRGS